uniref:Nuclear transport factor 2 n=1 Tax=Schistosoma japonicum TaxID=6182 RepID=C1LMM5_SCHJA|nr:Nuclear transport factor 2 [Schistosoma japonicum]
MSNYMLYPENYHELGASFVTQYYHFMQVDRNSVDTFYHPQARMTYEGQEIVGKDKIAEKFRSLPANTIQIVTTSVDVHPCENSILILVRGQLKCDEDPILPFCEMFFLRKFGNCFLISDSMFRLSLHNF